MENIIITIFQRQLQHTMVALCHASTMLHQLSSVSCLMAFRYMVRCNISHHLKEKFISTQDRGQEWAKMRQYDGRVIMNLDQDNCSDCVFKQIEDADLDECGGQEVADGSTEDGTV